MPRHHYSNRAILILENPWELDEGDCNRTSVLPFVEGIAKLAGDTEVFHANFYDKRSFDRALEILCSARFNNAVIYIAAHGNKGKVGGVKLEDILFAIGDHSKNTNITGIMLGSCFAGTDTDTIEVFMQGTNIKWCVGYSSSCDWLPATMIDCSIMASMLELDADSTPSGHPVHAHLARHSTAIWPPVPRPSGRAVGAQRRRGGIVSPGWLASSISASVCALIHPSD
ncbi:hypothetical protein [Pseudomonas aeruginosa]|uniref:hypothetical protein n=1 Tax=Pseudomonas aeruginosa TaxID=287 RepID=UPI001C9D7611|nr:hypothetical protein [Pseudomonas aeruginosa]QZV26185.1 hypothetical protein ITG67_14085 [Pseudomonas aeruginosa]WOE59177.1 hypothetical protein PA12_gene3863 [Pseudomonas aeruginosa]